MRCGVHSKETNGTYAPRRVRARRHRLIQPENKGKMSAQRTTVAGSQAGDVLSLAVGVEAAHQSGDAERPATTALRVLLATARATSEHRHLKQRGPSTQGSPAALSRCSARRAPPRAHPRRSSGSSGTRLQGQEQEWSARSKVAHRRSASLTAGLVDQDTRIGGQAGERKTQVAVQAADFPHGARLLQTEASESPRQAEGDGT